MLIEVKEIETPNCESGLSGFESNQPPQNKCPFCTESCGNEWCAYSNPKVT